MATNLIILAAGEGTRMKSDMPKVLHKIGGLPLYAHAVASGEAVDPDKIVLVIGKNADAVQDDATARFPNLAIAVQGEQLGTGHAAAQARDALNGSGGDAVVLYGDTPFIRPETLEAMQKARKDGHDVVVLGFEAKDPGRYGRLVTKDGALLRIVEFKDASEDERNISLCNSGVVMAATETLFSLIDGVGNDNAAGEYYLTDIVGIARERCLSATVVVCDEAETLGINTRAELADAEAIFQSRARMSALESGVSMLAPDTVHLSHDTALGRDVTVEQNVVFGPGVTVESGAQIRAFSHLEECHIGAGAMVGPYARLRPGTELGNNAKVGNFVEAKNAQIGEGSKVNHLTYVGDTTIGTAVNVGAGTVTCNYDGVFKHRTEIGDRAFIGSDTMLVAPIKIGADAMTATGSVITSDVPDGAMAIGRAKQEVKPGLARRMFEKMRAQKAKKG